MPQHILIIQGHPDRDSVHLCHALADAYTEGASASGHAVRLRDVSEMDFPILRSQREWEHGDLPIGLAGAQQDIEWAHHVVFIYPLWLGDMPALLKAFLEQVARPGFAFAKDSKDPFGRKGLRGRSAHIIVTMGMPALIYRWVFGAHSLKSFKRNVLEFVGFGPVRHTIIGGVGEMQPEDGRLWLERVEKMGRTAR